MGDPSPKDRSPPPIGVPNVAYFCDLSFMARTVSMTWVVDGQQTNGPTWQIEDLPERNPGAQANVSDGQRAQQLVRFVAGQISIIAACAPDGVEGISVFRGQVHAPETQMTLLVMMRADENPNWDHILTRGPIPERPTRIMLRLN